MYNVSCASAIPGSRASSAPKQADVTEPGTSDLWDSAELPGLRLRLQQRLQQSCRYYQVRVKARPQVEEGAAESEDDELEPEEHLP